jgi:WD40 repeat protein
MFSFSTKQTSWLALLLFIGNILSRADSPDPKLARDAMRLLHANCFSCHNAEKHKAGLELTSRELLLRGGNSGPVVDEKQPAESLLLKVLAPNADPHMPPKKQLSTNQIQLVLSWVSAGTPWDTEALAKAAMPREVKVEKPPPLYSPALALALSPDAKRLAVGRRDQLLIYDLESTNALPLRTVEAHADSVRSLAWDPTGTALASGGFREVKIWNPETLSLQHTFSNHLSGRIDAMALSPYGGALIVADGAATEAAWIRIFSPESGAEIAAWQAHNDSIYDLSLSPDGGVLATASADKMVKLWELVSRKEISQIEGHSGAVLGVAFNTNANEVVTISTDKQLKVWDAKSRDSLVTIGPRKNGFTAVAWSSNGKFVIATDDDGAILRFSDFKHHSGAQSSETASERQIAKWTEPVHSLAVSHDASRIAAGLEDGTVYVLNSDGKALHTFKPDSMPNPPRVEESPSFVRDVLPMLAKAGCMAGSCHAKPDGQNGFKLSVFSYDPKSDFKEIVKEARGRRVFPAAPHESLLLLKPTMAVEHGGGLRVEPGSETYQTTLKWIQGGMIYQHRDEPVLVRISVNPREGAYTKGGSQQLQVHAHYSDNSKRDVTHWSEFISNEKEIATVDEHGNVRIGSLEGEGVIIVRFMGFVDASRITVPASQKLPSERYAALPIDNFIDRLAYAHFEKLGLFPSEHSGDAEFLRRSSLDTIGLLPSPDEVRMFLGDPNPGKRRRWIEHLLNHPAYADFWASKWTDLLRPNPDRVGVKSIYFLDQWLRDAFRANKPYDQFVREIITVEGSNHQDGPVTVYRDRREPPELTTIFSQLFLGVRMECAKCHHHPTEKWSQDDFYQLAAFFGPVKQKGAGLSPPISAGTESFYFAGGGTVKHPVTEAVMKPRPLEANSFQVSESMDPRPALADWMTNPRNPFFAKAAVNRVWASFFGRGFVEPVDDFRISNPVSNEPLLEALASDFVQHGYDFKHLMRTILNSRVYQLSSTPNKYNLTDTKNFSRSYRRRLPAEVLLDAVNDVTGTQDEFNGCPPGTRAIQTWSYKVRSHFMDAFGRPNPSSDAPCERDTRPSVVQSLHMMNSKALQAKLGNAEGRVKMLVENGLSPEDIITELYLASFSRFPTATELETATAIYSTPKATRQTATEDVLWSLLNSPEFVFNH